jgi:3' terminal RNA ribose 2'-O-methyltransferase Hen1
MLLTITTTHRPATDLGFLLMKNPANLHTVTLPFGTATLFYTEANEDRCTAAVMLEVDAIELVRGKAGLEDQYVNDRPYAASSLLTVALGRLLNTAMSGRSKDRQELADSVMPLEATVTPLPARGEAGLLARLFEPLGYRIEATPIPLDPAHPEWGDSPYVSLRLTGDVRLAALLTHLFVLIPVLDNQKHYFIGEAEVEKLLRKGEGWLETHPERETIVRRYLRFRGLMNRANAALEERVEAEEPEVAALRDAEEEAIEKPIRLNDQRMERVVALLRELGAASVLDLGCGEGRLLRELLKVSGISRITGVEVAPRVLAAAGDRLRLESMPDVKRRRIELLQGSLVYRDDRLKGFDAAAVVEVIEHMDAERLPAFEAALFGHARPGAVIITTPNSEYNAMFETLPAGGFRHHDHRFEWSRAEFRHWAESVALAHGYEVRLDGIGNADPAHGTPTQLAVFTRVDAQSKGLAA